MSARRRMAAWVEEQYDAGLTRDEIKKEASTTFVDDKEMVRAGLSFLALLAFDSSQSISRKRVPRKILSSDPIGIFDNLRSDASVGARPVESLDQAKAKLRAFIEASLGKTPETP